MQSVRDNKKRCALSERIAFYYDVGCLLTQSECIAVKL